jgi:hypothetical protein
MAAFRDGDRLVSRQADWTELETISVSADENGNLKFTRIRMQQPPAVQEVDEPTDEEVFFRKPRPNSDDYQTLLKVRSVASRIILNSTRPPEANELVTQVSGQLTEIDAKLVRDFIRADVASGEFLVESVGKKKPKLGLRLSLRAMDAEQARAFASTFGEEITNQSRNIGLLIRHRPTTGNYREGLLRTLLQKYLPRRYHAATGFIFGSHRQLDIIIYDQVEYSPLFREGDLVVVPASAVRAVIEVKSSLTNQFLDEALEILTEAVPDNIGGPPIFKGVFAFDRESNASLLPVIRKFYDKGDANTGLMDSLKLHPIISFYTPITAACVLGKTLAVLNFCKRHIGGREIMTPVVFDVVNAAERPTQGAVFYDLLSRFLRHPFGGSKSLHSIGTLLASEINAGTPEWIYKGSWGPYLVIDDFPEGVDDLLRQTAAYDNWLDGQAWSATANSGSAFF